MNSARARVRDQLHRGAARTRGPRAAWRGSTTPASLPFTLGAALVAVATTVGACTSPSWTADEYPIDLPPTGGTPAGGLVARTGMDASNLLAVDTASPLTFVRGQADGSAHMTRRNFDILGNRPGASGAFPLRATFRDFPVLPVALDPAAPDIVLGADVLRGFSLQIDFAASTMTIWGAGRAPDSNLGAAACGSSPAGPTCFATLHFSLLGGGEVNAVSEPDFLGLTGPVEFNASRIVLRACAAPGDANPLTDSVQPLCCTRAAAASISTNATADQMKYAPTGTDVALVLATGLGPTVLAASAWDSIVARWNSVPGNVPLPDPVAGPPLSFPALPDPISDVRWTTLPRLALVDLESDSSTDPGSCVELARSRRTEWIERRRAEGASACTQPCDTDVRESSKAQNAAGYVELGGGVAVAIIPDGAAVLQTVRAELRQQGPQVDGFLGTDALGRTAIEIDYGASPSRITFSCPPGVDRAICLASPRCVRQAVPGDPHSCFGLPPLPLPATASCIPSGCP